MRVWGRDSKRAYYYKIFKSPKRLILFLFRDVDLAVKLEQQER